jgi:hypothetical protein
MSHPSVCDKGMQCNGDCDCHHVLASCCWMQLHAMCGHKRAHASGMRADRPHSDQRHIRFTLFEQKIVHVHLAKDVERQTRRCRCDVARQRSPLFKKATRESKEVPMNQEPKVAKQKNVGEPCRQGKGKSDSRGHNRNRARKK